MSEIISKSSKHLEELNKTMKEQAVWNDLDDNNFNTILDKINSKNDNIDWSKLTYNNAFDFDYYKKKFPRFDDDIIEILVKTSGKSLHHVFEKVEKKNISI
jgi:hypothetical protein